VLGSNGIWLVLPVRGAYAPMVMIYTDSNAISVR